MNETTKNYFLDEIRQDREDLYKIHSTEETLMNLYCYIDDMMILLGMRKYRKELSKTDDQIREMIH